MTHTKQWMSVTLKTAALNAFVLFQKNRWQFVGTLLQGNPSREALDAALAEHKARIKACKLGQGPNRHLLGLN